MGSELNGRTVVVTGGGHGIGRACCLDLASQGANVVVAELDGEAAGRVANEVEAVGGQALAVQTDVTSADSLASMVGLAVAAFGSIEGLVNNAAIMATIPMSRAGYAELSEDEWDRMMRVNVKGTWLATRAAMPTMEKAGYGKIVNVSSGTALKGAAGRIHYVTSKAAVIGFTRTLAREIGSTGVRVNCIAPGSTLSEANPDEATLRIRTVAASQRALGEIQKPEHVTGVVAFLVGPASDFMTGQTVVVDGGSYMH